MVILSGGDSSRLGYPFPKGLYNLPLESGHATLFSMVCERLRSLHTLSHAIFGKSDAPGGPGCSIPVYILVSRKFEQITRDYFARNDNFGLEHVQLICCDRRVCTFDESGQILLVDKQSLLKTSFGNGDLMDVLLNQVCADVDARGLEYLHISGIDNILNRPLDPMFMGFMRQSDLWIVHKIVPKQQASENVGLFVRSVAEGRTQVMEYTYFPAELKEKLEPGAGPARLKYRNANMLNLCVSREFLEFFREKASAGPRGLDSRAFLSKVNYTWREFRTFDPVEGSTSVGKCLKMERFFLDCFPLLDSARQGFITVVRADEFAAIKSSKGKDTPVNAYKKLLSFSGKVRAANEISKQQSSSSGIEIEQEGERFEKKVQMSANQENENSDEFVVLDEKQLANVKECKKAFLVEGELVSNRMFPGRFLKDLQFYQVVLKSENLI